MKAPPPIPELCGSTRPSMAWTATAASTALPPRFSTFRPACAARGLAAITNGESAEAVLADRAGVGAHEARATSARTQTSWRSKGMNRRLAEEEWRFKSIPLRSRAGGVGISMARQLEHFDNLVAMFLARAKAGRDQPFL